LPQPALGRAPARPPSEPPSTDIDIPPSADPLLLEPLLLLELLLLEPPPLELLLLLELLLEPFNSPASPLAAPASGIWGFVDVHANGKTPESESHTNDQRRTRGGYPAQSTVQESNRSGCSSPKAVFRLLQASPTMREFAVAAPRWSEIDHAASGGPAARVVRWRA
jgi:hypothetical protein